VPVTLLATTNIPAEDAGLASGLFNTAQQIGGSLGLAILSTLAATRTSHHASLGHAEALLTGYHLAFLVAAVLIAVAIVLLAALIRKSDVEQIQQEVEEPLWERVLPVGSRAERPVSARRGLGQCRLWYRLVQSRAGSWL
jgi:hypothetical protein